MWPTSTIAIYYYSARKLILIYRPITEGGRLSQPRHTGCEKKLPKVFTQRLRRGRVERRVYKLRHRDVVQRKETYNKTTNRHVIMTLCRKETYKSDDKSTLQMFSPNKSIQQASEWNQTDNTDRTDTSNELRTSMKHITDLLTY